MAKEFTPLSVRIKEVSKQLKSFGYIVINDKDEKFAILAEKKRILCDSTVQFFKISTELLKKDAL